MTATQIFNGVVLAGGQSSRMGQDKAQLEFNGECLVDRAQQLLKRVGAQNIWVNSSAQGNLADIYPNQGPLAGIHAALQQSKQNLLVIPVDMPLLTINLLQTLVERGQTLRRCTYYFDNPLPLFVVYSAPVLPYLQQVLTEQGSRSVKHFLQSQASVELATKDDHCLVNVNTPNQWQTLTAEKQI